jgi:hypothetical protein
MSKVGGYAIVGALFVAVGSGHARAAEAAALYDVALEATPKVAKGAQGRVVARITPKSGAHVSEEAPASLTLSASTGLAVSKARSGKGDLKFSGPAASFEVPFTASASGSGTIDATLKFYICTDTACTQQERKASLAVTVP